MDPPFDFHVRRERVSEQVAGEPTLVLGVRVLHTGKFAGVGDDPVQRPGRHGAATEREEEGTGLAFPDEVDEIRGELLGDREKALLGTLPSRTRRRRWSRSRSRTSRLDSSVRRMPVWAKVFRMHRSRKLPAR